MNNQIFFFFYNLAHKSPLFDKLVVFFAVYFPYIVVFLALVFLLFPRRFSRDPDPKASGHHYTCKEIISVFFSGGLAWVISKILKFLIHTQRPFDVFPQVSSLFTETGYAFPSGHAAFFIALAISIFLLHKKAGYTFMFFALIICLARIIAGVHFPVDILGGFLLGALVAYFVKNV